jgi:hypothetical protein
MTEPRKPPRSPGRPSRGLGDRKFHVLLGPERLDRLRRRAECETARARGPGRRRARVSAADIVRQAVDAYLLLYPAPEPEEPAEPSRSSDLIFPPLEA